MNPLELFRRFVNDLHDLDPGDVDAALIDLLIVEVQCAMDLYVAKVRTAEREVGGNFRRFSRKIGTNDLPRAPAIGRPEQYICGEV